MTETTSKTENVWDYPRPPAIEPTPKKLRVSFNGEIVAETTKAYRILETSHPPSYYFPPSDVKKDFLIENKQTSFCEWKGICNYYDIKVGDKVVHQAAWYYKDPNSTYKALKNYISFYPSKGLDCYVNDEKVEPQPGSFYGGWLTKDISGGAKGVKGGPGTWGW
eukprot:TRINITY_DN946_c0_g1_i1.p1 TRINITY_DN946_c0_g1~~TRINITY_DN946_c0_g1_i1.p1  ORF type:complete len:189 (-),score=41.63 TRINITY_DN946_c0_g1_i1:66-557(-)